MDGHVIQFCEEATDIVRHKRLPNVVGMHVISIKIGTHCYHGLCDIGAGVSVIPFSPFQEISKDISPCSIEETDLTSKLVDRSSISPVGIVRDVEFMCGKIKYPTYFLILGNDQDKFCPIFLVDFS